jgi:hypothetical protein
MRTSFKLLAASLLLLTGSPVSLARVYPREFMQIHPAQERGRAAPAYEWTTGTDTPYITTDIENGQLTRGEFITAIATRLYGTDSLRHCFDQLARATDAQFRLLFTDLAVDSPYAEAACAGLQNGWLRGNPDGSLRPDAVISAAEATAIIARISPEMSALKRPLRRNEVWYGPSWEAFVAVTGLNMKPGDHVTGTHLREWLCSLSKGTSLTLDPMDECAGWGY